MVTASGLCAGRRGGAQGLLDICDVYAVTSTNKKEAGQVIRSLEHTQVAHKFARVERSAVGRIDLGQWRDNPQLQIDVEGTKPVTVCLSVVRDAMKAVKGDDKKERKSGKKDKKVSIEGDEGSKEFDKCVSRSRPTSPPLCGRCALFSQGPYTRARPSSHAGTASVDPREALGCGPRKLALSSAGCSGQRAG